MNVALVGIGSHSSSNHAPSLKALADAGRIRLAAVCDLDAEKAERAAARYGFDEWYTSIESLYDGAALDAVVVVMPISAVVPVGKQVIARGTPVCIEKPMGAEIAEARDLADFAKGHHTPVMVSLNRRFDPGVRVAVDWLAERSDIRALHGIMLRHNRRERDFIWGTGIHLVDLLASLAGPMVLSHAAAPTATGRTGLLKSAHGIDVTLEIFPCAGRVEDRVRIVGDDCFVDLRTGPTRPWRVECWQANDVVFSAEAAHDAPVHVRNGTYDETRAFIDAVEQGRPMRPSLADALASSEVAAALQAVKGQGR